MSVGETTAVASISGPTEVRLASENPSKATFEVHVLPLSSVPETQSKTLSSTLRSLLAPSIWLNRNPRTLIQLVVQSFSPADNNSFGAGSIAAMINASTLALLNAAIQMKGVVCAAAVALLPSSPPALVLDLTDDHLRVSTASGCFAFMLTSTGVDVRMKDVWSNWQSMNGFDDHQLAEARNLARVGVKEIWISMRETLSSTAVGKEDDESEEADTDDEEKMEI
jgi:exosome complex component RRP46